MLLACGPSCRMTSAWRARCVGQMSGQCVKPKNRLTTLPRKSESARLSELIGQRKTGCGRAVCDRLGLEGQCFFATADQQQGHAHAEQRLSYQSHGSLHSRTDFWRSVTRTAMRPASAASSNRKLPSLADALARASARKESKSTWSESRVASWRLFAMQHRNVWLFTPV